MNICHLLPVLGIANIPFTISLAHIKSNLLTSKPNSGHGSEGISKSNFTLHTGVHPGGLFGCHDRPFYTTGRLLSINADKISKAVTAGLECEWFGTGNSLHFPSNIAYCYYKTTSLPCLNCACAMT